MTAPFWSENLRYLCGFHPSISEVCRRLGINRQQFNKYLSGQVRPSRYNLRRIADFFGIEPSDLDAPPARFAEIVSAPRNQPAAAAASDGSYGVYADLVRRSKGELDRYLGYYFRYFYSFGYPGYVIKSLAAIGRRGDEYVWSNVEVMLTPRTVPQRTVMKYRGTALYLGDRIFILECESLLHSSVTELILYPSYENPITAITGVQTGAPTVRGRKPTASTVLLQYLGSAPNLRRAIRACGIYPEDSPEIEPQIRQRVRNDLRGGGYVLEADES